ncbi:hypothetical protein LWC35_13070 [Pseudonocardia kujensis]|uniref:hypothetical protein n=1 Tax=Pseudonocardia kujensis TaxID=1128675 RepID=UPI001E5E7F09|nr:hypothetical protein [Pseudonocardia kujensis]MCE0763833.1 hypothetical protein [Pseudonocardia kujensis]
MSDDGGDRARAAETMRSAPAPALRAGFALCELSLRDLWTAQVALGGMLGEDELREILELRREPTWAEHDVVAAALNEWFTERGQDHPVAYSEELRGDGPEGP